MALRGLLIALFGLAFVSAAHAESLTEATQSARMTVVRVDGQSGEVVYRRANAIGRFSAPTHDLRRVSVGDTIKLDSVGAVVILRTAADDMGSPE
jgi:hypothetical protein